MREGRFREDLFHRLNVISLKLPPLRDRSEDIPLMVERFLRALLHRKRQALRALSPTARCSLLMDYDWPGNVRELENVVERAVVLSTHEPMDVELLPESVRTREIVKGVRLQLAEFLPPIPGDRPDAAAAPIALAISNHGRSRAPRNRRHAGAHQLEPNRSRRALPNPAMHAQPENQAPRNRNKTPQRHANKKPARLPELVTARHPVRWRLAALRRPLRSVNNQPRAHNR